MSGVTNSTGINLGGTTSANAALGTSGSGASQLLQLTGLSSGLDTNAIINGLMAVEKQPEVRLTQRVTVEQARQAALGQVKTQLQSLQTAIATLRNPATWGDTQTVNSSDPSLLSVTRTSGAAAGAHQVEITQLARANQWSSNAGPTNAAADDTIHITTGTGPGAVTLDVGITAGDGLDAVASKINAKTGTPVYATLVGSNLVLSNRTTGTAAAITGVTTDGTSGFTFGESQTAQDAQVKIDGTQYTRGSNTINDIPVLAGLQIGLTGTTTSPISITVGSPTPDKNAIQTAIGNFVTQYNSTTSFISGKLQEAPIVSPTNDADRAVGVLYQDPGLTSLMSSLRQGVADLVGGRPAGMSLLAQAGLSTGAAVGSGALNQSSLQGQLTLDTTALQNALTTQGANVKALFTNTTGSYTTEGLSQRLGDALAPWTSGNASTQPIIDLRISSSQTLVDGIQKQMTQMDAMYAARETALRSQFTALETALAKSQSMQSELTAQIAKL